MKKTEQILNNLYDKNGNTGTIEQAMQETVVWFNKWAHQNCWQYHIDLDVWVNVYHALHEPKTTAELFEIFNNEK
jgi:hypothetical protein